MVGFRRVVSVWGLASFLAVMGCQKNESTAPTPVTTPTPTPAPGATFSVSGTIFESAPTTSTRVPEAEVQLTGGVAAGSGADGTFTIPGVANGAYTLNVRKAGFNSLTQSVTVAGANVTGLTLNLRPTARIIDEIQDRRASPNNPPCAGTTRACQVVPIASHNDGESRFFVAWNNVNDELDLEFWCGGTRIAQGQLDGLGADEVSPAIVAGRSCELHIINVSNSSFIFTLYLTYPY